MLVVVDELSLSPFLTGGELLVGWLVGEVRPPASTEVTVNDVNVRDEVLMEAFLKVAPPLDLMDFVKFPLATLAVIDFVYSEYKESGLIDLLADDVAEYVNVTR